jgi:hypothetical protein
MAYWIFAITSRGDYLQNEVNENVVQIQLWSQEFSWSMDIVFTIIQLRKLQIKFKPQNLFLFD